MSGTPIQIGIRADAPAGIQDHSWRFIGFDECNYAQHPDGKRLLHEFGVLADAPYHVRTHHLFCTGNSGCTRKWGSTNIYREDSTGTPLFSWTEIDAIFDAIIESGNEPFVELGFMPLDLADQGFLIEDSPSLRYASYRKDGWSAPPKSFEKWGFLIESLANHIVDRYGSNRAESWYWELWNEPDLPYYWSGTLDDYCRLFDATEKSLHRILPDARLGGPATTGPAVQSKSLAFLDGFLKHCAQGTRLDFVSFHAKGGGFSFDPLAERDYPKVEVLVNQIRTGIAAVENYGMAEKEIVVSEADPDGWAAGGRFDNPNLSFRNTEYYASYVALAYAAIEEMASEYGAPIRPLAWAFMFPDDRCFEGTRVFSTHGIQKPVFKLFEMYSQLGNMRLNCDYVRDSGISVQAARDGENRITALIARHADDPDSQSQQPVSVVIAGLTPNDQYGVGQSLIDSEHSNAHPTWVTLGCPDYPTQEEISSMKSRHNLFQCLSRTEMTSDSGVVTVDLELPAHAITLVQIQKHSAT